MVVNLAVVSRAGRHKWYALRIVRPVERQQHWQHWDRPQFLNAPMPLSDAPMSLLFTVQRGADPYERSAEGVAPYEQGAVALKGISFFI